MQAPLLLTLRMKQSSISRRWLTEVPLSMGLLWDKEVKILVYLNLSLKPPVQTKLHLSSLDTLSTCNLLSVSVTAVHCLILLANVKNLTF